MAKQIITKITDDLDGTEADETVPFGLDGTAYEIDLSTKNAKALRDALGPFLAKAQKTGKTGGTNRLSIGTRPGTKENNREMREWLSTNGYTLPDRGRIAKEYREAYETQTPNPDRPALVERPKGEEKEAPAAADVPAVAFSATEKPQASPRKKAAPVASSTSRAPRQKAAEAPSGLSLNPVRKRTPAKKAAPSK
ncbi:histone-like nucleoid-structuring protein Lsr2 [Actinoplanes sp. CA-054009]